MRLQAVLLLTLAACSPGGEPVSSPDADAEPPAPEATVDEALLDREDLHRAVDALGEPDRTIVDLRHRERLDFAPIGERVGLTAVNAKSRYYRALSKLRERLAPARREALR